MIIETYSAEETYQLGMEIGKKASRGQVYTMVGDLGVGKTVFTKGFAEALGVDDYITSPTFTIVNEYNKNNKINGKNKKEMLLSFLFINRKSNYQVWLR